MADAQRPKDPRRWWKVATGFWFAVQRMDQPASDDPDGDDDDDEAGSGIPRRPARRQAPPERKPNPMMTLRMRILVMPNHGV